MDNKKIGKLIAELRKKKGLTQEALGDMVNVGFRAVSKWERGLSLPDISIINQLSDILGISAGELLKGEIDEIPEEQNNNDNKNTKNNSSKTKNKIRNIIITISSIILIALIIVLIIIVNNNRTYVYDLTSVNDSKHYVDGKVIFKGNDISIIINKLKFREDNLRTTIIKNYEYEINTNNLHIYRYGYLNNITFLENNISIEELSKNFSISYKGETNISRQYIVENNIIIEIKFLDENSQEFTEKIEIFLSKAK